MIDSVAMSYQTNSSLAAADLLSKAMSQKGTKKKLWSPEEDRQLLAWRAEGVRPTEAGRRMGVTKSAVCGRLWVLRKNSPTPMPKIPPINAGNGRGISFLREHVNYSGDDCLSWPMARTDRNSASFVGFEGKWYSAHRVMCIMAHGQPPQPNYMAAHHCGNSICVNPKHLFWKYKAGKPWKNTRYVHAEPDQSRLLSVAPTTAVVADKIVVGASVIWTAAARKSLLIRIEDKPGFVEEIKSWPDGQVTIRVYFPHRELRCKTDWALPMQLELAPR